MTARAWALGVRMKSSVAHGASVYLVHGAHEKLRRARGEVWGCIGWTVRMKSSVAHAAVAFLSNVRFSRGSESLLGFCVLLGVLPSKLRNN